MPIAGAAFGASKALEEILGEQMLRAQMQQREQQAAAQMEMERARFAEQQKQHEIDNQQRQQQIDMQAGDRRQRQNIAGVRRMLGEAITQRTGPMTSDDRRGMAALQVEAGDEPTMLNEPAVKRHVVTVAGQNGKPITKAVTEDELASGVEEYREPPKGEKPQVFNVGNGKLVDSNGRVIYDGGANGQGGPSPYASERNARTSAAVDDIVGSVNNWTAGYGGLLANLPQSEARKLRGKLDTLRANIAFNELAAMREASKTGGALGQVAVRELDLLQNSLGNLDQLQEPQSLIAELGKIRESAERWRQAAGGDAKAAPMQPVTSRGGATSAPASSAAPRRMKFDRTGKLIP